jgi:hypothetical protein
MTLIRSAPLGERACLGVPAEFTDAVGAIEIGGYQGRDEPGAERDQWRREAIRDGVGIS